MLISPLRLNAWFLLVTVSLWLLPLGAFIKPSQEKIACDGQRPFHMCCMMSGKIRPAETGSSKVSISNSAGVNNTSKSTGSGGDEFLLVDPVKLPDLKIQNWRSRAQNPVYLLFSKTLDLPPETNPLF